TKTNTGVEDIVFVASTDSRAKPLYYDKSGNITDDPTITGLPAITAVPQGTAGAQLVYVNASFQKTFDVYGNNLITNGDFSQQVPTNGFANGWTSFNNTGDAGWSTAAGPN